MAESGGLRHRGAVEGEDDGEFKTHPVNDGLRTRNSMHSGVHGKAYDLDAPPRRKADATEDDDKPLSTWMALADVWLVPFILACVLSYIVLHWFLR
uniref:Uncharacterized protein n=1 Tax=Hemiselmis tepida TaxID=464990 RepID=A0A7S0VCR7_9CRYP